MADSDNHSPSLGEGAARFLATLSTGEREASQPEVTSSPVGTAGISSFPGSTAPSG